MEIKDVNFGGRLLLAPMAGVSDVGFRTICLESGADLVFTEMISSQALKFDSSKTKDMLITHKVENKKIIAQIFGNDSLIMSQAVSNELLSKFVGLDINMGCPAHKIIKNGEGAFLLKNLIKASQIIKECKKVIADRTLSVKVRLGFDNVNVKEIVKMCEEAGADFITVHGRTAVQGYSGTVDYDAIAKAKASVNIPVIGNGDVRDKKSYELMLQTGVDGVMIGRGAVGKPWLFSELKSREMDCSKFKLIKKHVDILRNYYSEKWLTLYLRKHFLAYASTFKAKPEIKKKLAVQSQIDESLDLIYELSKHFEN